MVSPETDYIKDHYGECNRGSGNCICLRQGPWRGRLCPNWVPTTASTWEEVKSNFREMNYAGGSGQDW